MAGPAPSATPPPKRAKLEPVSPKTEDGDHALVLEPEPEVDEDHCTICLQAIADRAVIPTCSHEFCFECLMIWSEQSRRCPLCAQTIGDYLIHHIRSSFDYQKHFLPPLRTSPRPLPRADGARAALAHRRRERVWGPRDRAAQDEADALERAVSRRRWIYHHHLYAKHVASNKYTRYRPFPTPAQFAASQDLISRTTVFLRRELLVWPNADVEFLVTFVISLMKSIDIRSESAIKLLAEFLDMDAPYVPGERHVNAEHFAHEIYCYLRSPYRDLGVYDSVAQYDIPPGTPPPPLCERVRRWESRPPQSRSQSPNLRRSYSHPGPPATWEWSTRPERSPQMLAPSHEQDPGRSRSLADDPRIHDGAPRSGPDEDDRPARQHCLRPRPPAGVKAKGKQRALARSVSPPSQSDIWRNSPAARHEPTASPEISTAPTGSPLSENSSPAERSTTAASRPAGDVRSEGAGPPVSPRSESNSGGSRVPSPPLPDGNSNTAHATRTTDASPFPLEELHSLNDGIVASSRAKSETPEPLTINLNHPRTNLVRQARYRSQRDAIIAHLRASSTTRKNRSSAQPRHKSSLLARTTDEAVEKLNVPEEVDADITEGASGGAGCARLPSRTAERSSGPSVNDDPSGRRRNENETTVTKAWTEPSEAPPLPPPPRLSHVHLLVRLGAEKATASEARLRTQVRLRARLAAERLLAQDDEKKGRQ